MGSLNLEELSSSLCKGVRILVFVRRLAKEIQRDPPELKELEMEFRERGSEVIQALKATRDKGKPAFLEF